MKGYRECLILCKRAGIWMQSVNITPDAVYLILGANVVIDPYMITCLHLFSVYNCFAARQQAQTNESI